MRVLKNFLFIIIFAAVIFGGAKFVQGLGETEIVNLVHPKRGPAVQAVYATGTVEATVMMPIAPRITARLTELNVDEGSAVKKDEVLAKLEDEDFEQTIKELRARQEYARTEYNRRAGLVEKGAVSKSDFERARSDWEAAKAALAKATVERDFMKLTAPADGYVIRRDGEIGQLIPANQPVLWLSCCAPLRISAEVDEEDISLVQPGQEVLIRADAFPNQSFIGEVQSITPKGDPVARSYRVRIGFQEEVPLLIGMTAETNIIVRETKDALLIPTTAVLDNKVWVIEEDKLVSRAVKIGAKGPEQTEIISGLTVNDEVVDQPNVDFAEGERVKIKSQSK